MLTPPHNELVSSVNEPAVTTTDTLIAENTTTSEHTQDSHNGSDKDNRAVKESTAVESSISASDEQNSDDTDGTLEMNTVADGNDSVVTQSPIVNDIVADEVGGDDSAVTQAPAVNEDNNDNGYVTQPSPITTEVQPDTKADDKPTSSETPVDNGEKQNFWCILISSLNWNGATYRDNDMANVSAYTQDRYIGKVSDFEGEYGDRVNYRISPSDSVYTVKETSDVLFVVKADANSPYGAIVVMSTPDWSIEKYESERLETGYIDPNDTTGDEIVEYNGFCQ